MNYGIRYVGADDSDSLEHYGVLGMKWGVHRGRTAQVYAKAQKKLVKIDRKADKMLRKKYKHANPIIRTKISDALYESATRKYDKAISKGIKWYKKSAKILGEKKVNTFTNSEGIAVGKKYADMLKNHKL